MLTFSVGGGCFSNIFREHTICAARNRNWQNSCDSVGICSRYSRLSGCFPCGGGQKKQIFSKIPLFYGEDLYNGGCSSG